MTKIFSFKSIAAAGVLALASATIAVTAYAQGDSTLKSRHTADEIAKAKPSATLELEAEQFRLFIGGEEGKGTLMYKGKSYPFKVKAASVGGVGVTKTHSIGKVYFLNKVEDFAGTYTAVSLGAAVGSTGMGGSQFENQKGVFISVHSKNEGLALNLGIGVVEVTLIK